MLRSMEESRQFIMREINSLGLNDGSIRRTMVFPMARVKPMYIKDYPVFHFGYEGVLPPYDVEDHDYNAMIRQYYYSATFDSYDYSKLLLPVIDKATIIIAHYFSDMTVRDLDNRNGQYIQDAIKLTGIIKDDNWQNVWNSDIAFYDKNGSHVQVYVVPTENYPHFIGYLIKKHEELKKELDDLPKISAYEKKFIEYQRKKEQEEALKIEKRKAKLEQEEKMFF